VAAGLDRYSAQPPYGVRLDFFSGPLDLLLHLVHQREVSIEQVDLSEVCEQYLQIVSAAVLLDLDKATEYLVIAATLIAMKSQVLLPSRDLSADNAGSEEQFDSRFFESLREKLKAFEMTKLRACALVNSAQLGVDTFCRGVKGEFDVPAEIEISGDSHLLGSAFVGLLRRIGAAAESFRVRLEPVSVVSCMMKIIDRMSAAAASIGGAGRQSLLGLVVALRVPGTGVRPGKKSALIGTFIAVLELARRGILSAEQDEAENDIRLVLREQADCLQAEGLESEFDETPAVAAKVVRLARPGANEEDITERKEASVG
jgi:segregation and condensation protein A